ncbi:MAG: GAF domain-containing sensor histidine kinase [Chloroflexi bacterium]|nr:GAF domain-containing sensor histidine kinase [Chloroflexota bacterium]
MNDKDNKAMGMLKEISRRVLSGSLYRRATGIAARAGRPLLAALTGDPGAVSIRILKVLVVVTPGFFVWVLESTRHAVFGERYSDVLLNFLLALVVAAGAFIFSRVVFNEIESVNQQVVRRNQELEVLNTVASAVNLSLSLDTVLKKALEQVLHITRAEAAEIFLTDPRTRKLRSRALAGIETGIGPASVFDIGQGPVGRAAELGEPVFVDNAPKKQPAQGKTTAGSTLSNLACIPLLSENKTIGVFTVGTIRSNPFSGDDIRLLASTGKHIAVAIENARLHEEVQAAATIEERERLAREMHDGVAQVLSFINMKTQALKSFLSAGEIEATRAQIQELEDSCQEAYAEVRDSILGLRLASTHGSLEKALQEYITRFKQASGLAVVLDADSAAIPSMSSAAEVQIIRIVQEALTNVRKHARARNASVTMKAAGDKVCVTISDDGQGFEQHHTRKGEWPQFGLQTMRERAECVMGSLDILSTPGRGTTVTLRVPATVAS